MPCTRFYSVTFDFWFVAEKVKIFNYLLEENLLGQHQLIDINPEYNLILEYESCLTYKVCFIQLKN